MFVELAEGDGGRSYWWVISPRTRAGTSGYWDEPSTPLFPFGHGLSYTTFEVSGAAITPNPSHTMFTPGDVFNVSGTIKSSGPAGRITLFAFFSQVCVRRSLKCTGISVGATGPPLPLLLLPAEVAHKSGALRVGSLRLRKIRRPCELSGHAFLIYRCRV